MIAKLIKMRRSANSPARERTSADLRQAVFALTQYITDADPYALIESAHGEVLSITDYALAIEEAGIEPGEKVEAFGARNLVGDDLAAWQAQMLAVSARAPKMKSPMLHIILSLRETEGWTPAQREEAIDVVLEMLGLEQCQTVWSEHSNTVNPHLHLAVVRVDPATGRAAGSDWLIDDLHQAIAILDERHGRTREEGALYIAREGAVHDAASGVMVRDAAGKYIPDWRQHAERKRDRLGADFAHRRAALVTAAGKARNWAELHRAFAGLDAIYDSAGSGARIGIAGRSEKASSVDDSLKRGALEKRFGPFVLDAHRLDPLYEAFMGKVRGQLADLRARREAECERLDGWAGAMKEGLGEAKHRLIRQAIDREAADARRALQLAFKAAIAECIGQRLSRDKWIEAGRPPYREVASPALILPCPETSEERSGTMQSRFRCQSQEWETIYVDERGEALFTDRGVVFLVHKIDRQDAIDDVLLMAAGRWGRISLSGTDEFLKVASARAAALGIEADLPETFRARQQSAEEGKSAQQPSPPIAPDEELSPQERLERAIKLVRSQPALPLRRAPVYSPQWSGRPECGPLEIVRDRSLQGVEKAAIQSAMSIDWKDEMQIELEHRRRQFLAMLQAHLLQSGIERLPQRFEEVEELLPKDKAIRLAARVASKDWDFREMLRQLRERELERSVSREKPAQKLEQNGKPADRNSAAQGIDDDGYTAAQLAHFMHSRGIGSSR